MTETEDGRCLIIPVGHAGIVVLCVLAVALLMLGSFGGPEAARGWGLLCGMGAATWTVLYGLARQRRLLEYAFEVGRETGERSVRSVP